MEESMATISRETGKDLSYWCDTWGWWVDELIGLLDTHVILPIYMVGGVWRETKKWGDITPRPVPMAAHWEINTRPVTSSAVIATAPPNCPILGVGEVQKLFCMQQITTVPGRQVRGHDLSPSTLLSPRLGCRVICPIHSYRRLDRKHTWKQWNGSLKSAATWHSASGGKAHLTLTGLRVYAPLVHTAGLPVRLYTAHSTRPTHTHKHTHNFTWRLHQCFSLITDVFTVHIYQLPSRYKRC